MRTFLDASRWTLLLPLAAALLAGSPAAAQSLLVDGETLVLGGVHSYDTVEVVNGGRIQVTPYDGADKVNTGNLQLRARTIFVDESSEIVAWGAGYQPRRCDNGPGPNAAAGGRGGCAVLDSGGGGGHFGAGGRGTKDCDCYGNSSTCQFPQEFEESCGQLNSAGTGCVSLGGAPAGTCPSPSGTCYTNDGLPTVAGGAYTHSIYEHEFGAAGGDKGCRDGWDSCNVAGAGGGRIVLAAVNEGPNDGVLTIHGRIRAEGKRGCGSGNDSGGGGAGGSILLVGDSVLVSNTALVSAAGGLGGDTNAKQPGAGCPSCAQNPGGTCDDCGGGGGGGIISVLSRSPAELASLAVFDVSGADGGTCPICRGEAGGGAGELQLSGVYTGEFCDGYDNDFDGVADEGLGSVTCGQGSCQTTVAACDAANPAGAQPNDCQPTPQASCLYELQDTRSRFLVIADTSGSMLTDLSANYTFGDGSVGHLGLDTDGDGTAGNDSRLYMAKESLTQVISAYPEIDFGLARFAQGVGPAVNCQLAHWFECAGLCCTYDNPQGNSGVNPEGPCTVAAGAAGTLTVLPVSGGEECINYAGSCGAVRRGADVLVGFDRPLVQSLMWLDHQETSFNASTSAGDHCNFAGGGDCELRGTGPTPIAGALYSALAYLRQEKPLDPIGDCRQYAVILLTDGSETCGGDPVAAAESLLSAAGVETYVIGFSVLASELQALNAIANAGSASGSRPAIFAGDEQQLTAALASIVADSVRFERCNELDDDCDLLIDEDFPQKGQPCNNGKLGTCYRTGQYVCKADGSGVECQVEDGGSGTEEICNGLDDNCNGQIDEDIPGGCVIPICQPEICNNLDDDCDGLVDNNIPSVPCGTDVGECTGGTTVCEEGILSCQGAVGPFEEICNGLDDDCDGVRDGMSQPCYSYDSGCNLETGECLGTCKLGAELCEAEEQQDSSWLGVWRDCLGDVGPVTELCDGLDNNCDGELDDQAECPGGSSCIEGSCTQPCASGEFGCPVGFLCVDDWCVPDPCDPALCEQDHPGWLCRNGECIDPCLNRVCGPHERCVRGACVDVSCYATGCPAGELCVQGVCQTDPCYELTCGAGEYCSEGTCVQLCERIFCGAGEVCQVVREAGKPVARCLPDPCLGVTCPEGRVCVEGKCVIDPCRGINCPRGQLCQEGQCVADACELIRCPVGYSCQGGGCQVENVEQTDEVLASGGGGLSCQLGRRPGSGGLALLLLGLLLLAVSRRRRG